VSEPKRFKVPLGHSIGANQASDLDDQFFQFRLRLPVSMKPSGGMVASPIGHGMPTIPDLAFSIWTSTAPPRPRKLVFGERFPSPAKL
jgi:hypothetical protein